MNSYKVDIATFRTAPMEENIHHDWKHTACHHEGLDLSQPKKVPGNNTEHDSAKRTIMKTIWYLHTCYDGDRDLLAPHKNPSWWKTAQAAHSLWC